MRIPIVLLRLSGCALPCCLALLSAAEDPRHGAPREIDVRVVEKSLIINGTTIPWRGTSSDFTKLLGKPSRVREGSYNIIVWDEQGLYATQDSMTEHIVAFTIALDKKAFPYWPMKMFSGKVSVDGAAITAESTIENINLEKKGKPFKRNEFIADSYTLEVEETLLSVVQADPKLKVKKQTSPTYKSVGNLRNEVGEAAAPGSAHGGVKEMIQRPHHDAQGAVRL